MLMEFRILEVLRMNREPKHMSATYWIVNWLKSE